MIKFIYISSRRLSLNLDHLYLLFSLSSYRFRLQLCFPSYSHAFLKCPSALDSSYSCENLCINAIISLRSHVLWCNMNPKESEEGVIWQPKKKKIKTVPSIYACQNSTFVTKLSQAFCSCGTLAGHSGVTKVSFSNTPQCKLEVVLLNSWCYCGSRWALQLGKKLIPLALSMTVREFDLWRWPGQQKIGAWKDTWEVCCQSTEPGVDLWEDPRQYFKIFEYLLSLILLTCKCKLLGLWKHNEFLFVLVSFV